MRYNIALFAAATLLLSGITSDGQQLKVDFNGVNAAGEFVGGSVNQEGFQAFNMQHETIGQPFDVIRTEVFPTGWGDISITTSTDADPAATNLVTVYQAITRNDTLTARYNGTMPDLARDWTGIDTRSAGATTFSLTIAGLPAGSYDFLSYHQDVENQTGQFDVLVNGELRHSNVDIKDSGTQNPGAGNPPYFIITPFESDGTNPTTISFRQTSITSSSVVLRFFVLNGFVLAPRGEAALVASFTSSVESAFAGQSFDLSWNVSPGATVTIEPGIGDVSALTTDGAGTTTVTLDQETNYTITATKGTESETRNLTVGLTPDVVSFSADPANVAAGGSTTLSWEVNPNASVTIEPGFGNVDAQTTNGVGSVSVSPSATTAYTLTVDRAGVQSTASITITVVTAPSDSTLDEGLIAYWPLDELQGTKTPDVVNALDMEAINITGENIVPGRFGNAFSFVNSQGTLLSRVNGRTDELPANQHSSFTVSFWAKVNGIGQRDLRMFSEGSTKNNTPLFNIGTHNTGADGAVDIYIRPAGTEINHAKTVQQPLDGVDWHHIVFVQDQGQRSIYIDGTLDSVVLNPLAAETFPVDVTSIGGIMRASACCIVTGLIDEVAIWKRALTEAEILELNVNNLDAIFPPLAKGLVAHWPLDELQGSKTPDVVNGLDMEATNITAERVVPGKIGNAISFSNPDQTLLHRVHTPADELPANKHESFTVSFWANVNGVGQRDLRLFSEGSTQNNTPLFNLGTHSTGANGSVDVFIRPGATEINHARTEQQPLDGVDWHHIVFVQDQDQRSIYIDGNLDSVVLNPRVATNFPVNVTSIGGIMRASACCIVSGLIDDVAIWKRALTPEEVVQLNVNGVPDVFSKPLPMEIRQFTADFPAVAQGDTVVLRWDVTADATITIDQGVGDVTAASQFGVGSITVPVTEPTVFRLTITRGDEERTADVAVNVIGDVAEGWRLLESFDTYEAGAINGMAGWKQPDGAGVARVIDLGANSVLGFAGSPVLSALELKSLALNEGEQATLFMRTFVSSADQTSPVTIHLGLTERPIRFTGDFGGNVGPFVRFEKADGQGLPVEVKARNGIGAEFTTAAITLESDTVYNLWIDINNRTIAEGDTYSVYIQKAGDAERTLVFEGFLSDRSPDVDPFFGPPLPDLIYLFFALLGGNQGTDNLLFDDIYISKGGFNAIIPVPASPFEFVEPSLDILLSAGLSAEGFTIAWNSEVGSTYTVETSPDLTQWTPLATNYPDGGATTTVTTFTDTAASESVKFYRVVFVPPPALLEEDFEAGAAGWTATKTGAGATIWELGVPANGPTAAHSGQNVWGTDLDADYAINTDTRLRSPIIDLTGKTQATLEFWHFLDVEPAVDGVLYDFGEVNVLDANGNVLAESVFKAGGTTPDWRRVRVELSGAVVGQPIQLEFRMVGDDFLPQSGETQAGWFIDDVVIIP